MKTKAKETGSNFFMWLDISDLFQEWEKLRQEKELARGNIIVTIHYRVSIIKVLYYQIYCCFQEVFSSRKG